MRKKLALIGLIIAGNIACGQQHVQFTQAFAPSMPWINASEKPYRQNICLNGNWGFAPATLPAGFKEGVDPAPVLPRFSKPELSKTPIRIPSPWNVNSFADKDGQGGDFITYPSYPKTWETVKMGWLYKEFQVPQNWKNKRISLHFEAIAGDAQIIINGHEVAHHFEIFLPFDVDVTDFVKYVGTNELCVGVRKASLFDHRSDHGRRTYQAGSFWGQHIAGIWQDVELVATAKTYISDVFIRPLVDSGKLIAEVHLRNDTKNDAIVELGGTVYAWQNLAKKDLIGGPVPVGVLAKTPALKMEGKRVKIAAGQGVIIKLSANARGKLNTWSPSDPQLYGLIIHEIKNGSLTDSKYTRFGWRQTSILGKQFLLNGKPFLLKGDSWHFMGIPQMTRRYAWSWFNVLKQANLNAVRLHAEPYPPFYLDVADEMGIMVLDESAMWASDGGPKLDDPKYWKDSEDHMAGLVRRDRNHASIFGWSVSNEIMPIVRGVMHDPPGMQEQLIDHYRIWADSCRKLDPTRPWISADGEDDGNGRLPVYVVHYGGFVAMDRGLKSSKPWGVGEAGNAYYGTPEQVAATNGDRAYESFLGRMEGVAISSYQTLIAERERHANYQSVFNLAWYGLQPLSLGLRDTTRAPQISDGVYFNSFKEGAEGVQPERLGPYTTTFNPGYDPAIPFYKSWPLFEAIRDASVDGNPGSKWAKSTTAIAKPAGTVSKNSSYRIAGGTGSQLEVQLKALGLLADHQVAKGEQLLLVDGELPPDKDIAPEINEVLAKGGKVIVWNVGPAGLEKLNALLPDRLELTKRAASSLVIRQSNSILNGIGLSDLYFSEQSPAEVIKTGLTGAMASQGETILEDCNTDWLKWNKQPEYAKTAMVIRSERESKPSGAVMITSKSGNGDWLITTLPASSRLFKVQLAIRKMLVNLGLPFSGNNASAGVLEKGKIIQILGAAITEPKDISNALNKTPVDLNKAAGIKIGSPLSSGEWKIIYDAAGNFTFGNTDVQTDNADIMYLSCWISSPRSLEDLLLEPNLPTVNFKTITTGLAQAWLNGNPILTDAADKTEKQYTSVPLKLRQGWNHLFIKLIRTGDKWQFSGRLVSNQPEFLEQLSSALEKP